jgi:SAM-dependent methyltransferase
VEKAVVAMKGRIAYTCCPLCGAELCDDTTKNKIVRQAPCSAHPLYQSIIDWKMTWQQCRSCGHIFTDGYMDELTKQLIFSRTLDVQKPGADYEKMRFWAARIIDRVRSRSTTLKKGIWMDVGPGDAALLMTAKEYGYMPIGIEARAENARQIRTTLEIECRNGIAEDIGAYLAPDQKCSVVSMADVLEHLPYPAKALHAAYKALDVHGMLFISTPNADCPLWHEMDRDGVNPYWGEIEHYHCFTYPRLAAMLRETGFNPVDYSVSERYRCGMQIIAAKMSYEEA